VNFSAFCCILNGISDPTFGKVGLSTGKIGKQKKITFQNRAAPKFVEALLAEQSKSCPAWVRGVSEINTRISVVAFHAKFNSSTAEIWGNLGSQYSILTRY